MTCAKQFTLDVVANWPNFLFTDLFANNSALSSATINGYDKLAGQPPFGTDLGSGTVTAWTVSGAASAYTISYQCDSIAGPGDAGNWRVTIDNSVLVPTTLSFPLTVDVYVNAVLIYQYFLNASTGPLFVDTAIANGDTLSFVLAVDGNLAPAASYQTTVTATQLP
jgi:hypothetical protein